MASYRKYRHAVIKGERSSVWYVEIHKKNFTGTSTEMILDGEGFEITWNGQGSTRERVFLGSECVLNFMVQNDNDETDLYNIVDSGFKEYFIRVYKNAQSDNSVWWYGWIQPGFDNIQNTPYPYSTRITATDSYGYYSKQEISFFANEDAKKQNHSIKNIFRDFLHNMEIAPVNLVDNPSFTPANSGFTRWNIRSGDTISQGFLSINGTSGSRYPLSCEGDTLVAGDKYKAQVDVVSYTTGTLSVVDGGAGQFLGAISSTGTFNYSWTQSAASGGNGFHLYTDNGFDGTLSGVYVYRDEDVPCPEDKYNLKTAIHWNQVSDKDIFSDDADKYYICKGAFANDSNFPLEYKESEPLNEALKIFNCVGILAEGAYHFFQPNSYVNNYNGYNKFWTYRGSTIDPSSSNIYSMSTINQTATRLLGGSNFTYDPPLKSVSATYTSVGEAGEVSQGVGICGLTYGGQILADTDYTLNWHSTMSETFPYDNILGYHNYSIGPENQSIDYYITIQAVSSSSTKYLYYNTTNNQYEWSATQKELVFSRGYIRSESEVADGVNNSYYSEKQNDDSVEGALKNYAYYREGDPVNTVSKRIPPNGWFRVTSGDLKFSFTTPQLTETSNIYITQRHIVRYRKEDDFVNFSYEITPTSIIDPTLVTRTCVVEQINLEAEITTSLQTNEQRFVAYQSQTSATETLDLGEVVIGVTENDVTFALTDINNEPVTGLFCIGTSTSKQANFTQLLVNQFLELQQKPLQILQGDIQASTISPLRMIKYALNADSNYNYYQFLGGTFKGQSEILSGEWFRLED